MRSLFNVFKILQILAAFSAITAMAPNLASASSPVKQNQSQNQWRKVENSKVSMVTDMVFPRDQIPIQVTGKTYYGCCENCKERLGKDESVRSAIDPLSGKSVDKAKASIAAGPDGSVIYFENDANLEKYVSSQK